MTQSLFELEQKHDFVRRHIGPGDEELSQLLATIGAEMLDDLITQTVPAAIRLPGPLGIGAGMTEVEALDKLRGYAAQNKIAKSYIGMGYHDAQPAGKPGLVYRLHPVAARASTWPSRSPAQLPAADAGSDRYGSGQCLPAG